MDTEPRSESLKDFFLPCLGSENPDLLHKTKRAWTLIHRKGKEFCKRDCRAKEPYRQWEVPRVKEVNLPYNAEVLIPPLDSEPVDNTNLKWERKSDVGILAESRKKAKIEEYLKEKYQDAEVLHLKVAEVTLGLGPRGFSRKFLEEKAWVLEKEGKWIPLSVILALLIYGVIMFPNDDDCINSSIVGVFLSGNSVTALVADVSCCLHTRHEKKKEPRSESLKDFFLPCLGSENLDLLHKIKRAWTLIHRKGKEFCKRDCRAKEPYRQWEVPRVKEVNLPYNVEVLVPPLESEPVDNTKLKWESESDFEILAESRKKAKIEEYLKEKYQDGLSQADMGLASLCFI
ncbi:hypothetical protein KIW84_021761 [Lathyrus oleraceus]|uniref:DUF7745 domain-containing protein n=1 Tax=Pisum sativum TaxID=3888 RepID=A0A9D4YAQ9_PEA|nr:hypothetical protein KIW84_021761 [Pisum sativum]